MKLYAFYDANFHYVILGFLIEFFVGYPSLLPHPIVYMGKTINFFEWLFYGQNKEPKVLKRRGIIIALSLVILTYAIFGIIDMLFSRFLIGWFIKLFFAITIVATGSLLTECNKVLKCLKSNDIDGARKQLSTLVTRDTSSMNEEEIIRTTIETLSENLCDGIIAPLFYMFIGGIPLGMAYKMVSTLDSMVGYKNERYIHFGWFSAKLDDLANWIPSRLTAFFIFISANIMGYNWRKSIEIWERDRKKTESPNSGNPESAFAGAIGVWFGGKVNYFGKVYEKPVIGDVIDGIKLEHLEKSLNLAMGTSFVALVLMTFVEVILRIW